MTIIPSLPLGGPRPTPDWDRLARVARRRRWSSSAALYTFLIAVSVPLLIPYLGLLVLSFSSRDPAILWRALAILAPTAMLLWLWAAVAGSRVRAFAGGAVIIVGAAVVLTLWIGPDLHLRNFRFLLGPPRTNFPSIWVAFRNSLMLAVSQTLIVTTIASLAAYYLSRFHFPLRGAMLRALLVLHAFPVMTLIVPLFLMLNVAGLLDTLLGVILVLVALELPFAVFILKGFFDAVPWDIEMSAIVDGASRRQAFVRIVLPQVTNGLIAVAVFTFIRGWEEYIFVSTFLIRNTNWVMSLYLFFLGNAPAVALFYLLPPLVLYLLTQKYLFRMSVGVQT